MKWPQTARRNPLAQISASQFGEGLRKQMLEIRLSAGITMTWSKSCSARSRPWAFLYRAGPILSDSDRDPLYVILWNQVFTGGDLSESDKFRIFSAAARPMRMQSGMPIPW